MNIWVPRRGEVDIRAWSIDRRVREYDERLMFGRNESTGDWCIFIRMPAPSDPFPVIGFQDRIPEPDEALDRLRAADTMRHGDKIYKDAIRSQMKYRDDLEYASDQAASESVDAVEFLLRKHGKSPVVKSTRKVVSK